MVGIPHLTPLTSEAEPTIGSRRLMFEPSRLGASRP
jgi:hypothetical protein